MTKTPELPVLHIYHNNEAYLYPAKVREDKMYCRGQKVPQFDNSAVLTVKDLRGRVPRKFKMAIYLDGKAKVAKRQDGKTMKVGVKLQNQAEIDWINEQLKTDYKIDDVLMVDKLETIPDSVETLYEPLTFHDRVTVVKREIAKQLGKFKPMETWQFIVIMALLGANLALQFIF